MRQRSMRPLRDVDVSCCQISPANSLPSCKKSPVTKAYKKIGFGCTGFISDNRRNVKGL